MSWSRSSLPRLLPISTSIQSNRALTEIVQGGFFFHPSDKDLSPGWKKKPLGGRAVGKYLL
jgi:hypothetical protein